VVSNVGQRERDESLRFVGRVSEVATLRGLVDGLADRLVGRVAVVEGEAGIGKSRLLEEALTSGPRRRCRILRSCAEELERERPFGPLIDALDLTPHSSDPERAALGRLLLSGIGIGVDAQSRAPDVRFRVVEGIVGVVERLATERPLALVVEDVHWVDPATVVALHRLSHRVEDLPLALLMTCRPTPRSRELQRFLDALPGSSLRLALGGLDRQALSALASEALGAPPGSRLVEQLQGTAGNPLFATELLWALRGEGSVELARGHAEVATGSLPPPLRLTILRRLGFLPAPTLQLLEVATALGATFSLADLALVVERPVLELLESLREPLAAGVLREAGARLAFRHDLVREAIYEDVPLAVRSALHLQAARALASAGRPAAQVATHFALAASPGERDAVVWLRRAAREVAGTAPAVAAGFLERAIALAGEEHPEQEEIRAELTRSLLWAGRVADAEALASEMLRDRRGDTQAASLTYALGRALAYQGRMEDSIAHLERTLTKPELATRDRAQLVAELAHRYLLHGQLTRAQSIAQAAHDLAQEAADELALWTSLCALSWTAAARGAFGLAIELAERAVATAAGSAGEAVAAVQPTLYLAFVLIDADHFADAERLLREGLTSAEERGTAWALPLHHAGLALLHFQSGAWDDALAEAETSLALAEELGTSVWKPAARGVIGQIAYHRGDLARAEAMLSAADREPATHSVRYWAPRLVLLRALLLEAAGHRSEALSQLEDQWNHADQALFVAVWRELAPEFMRLGPLSNRRETQQITAAIERFAATAQTPGAKGAALRCRGLLATDPQALIDATVSLRASPRPLERALACEQAAATVAATAGAADAVPILTEAIQHFEQIGASRDIARVDATLRQLGIHRGRRGSRRRPEAGWESLTESERRVATLVAEGLTNRKIAERLYVSPRTIETHVSHALLKLDLGSRVQLAAEAARRTSQPGAPTAPTTP
jgi:DNA-binding CsgD family transcriptional regulator